MDAIGQRVVKVLLIRHAESEFNLAQRIACNSELEVPGHQECLMTKFNEQLLDCGITEEGYNQCKSAREICSKEDVAVVYVSPLRRALETCKEIFENHKSKPKIFPHPLFREMLLSNCDIGARVVESRDIYKDDDFSFLSGYKYPNLWSVYELLDKSRAAEVITEIEILCDNNEEEILKHGHLKLLDIIKRLHPDTIESQEDCNKRTELQKKLFKEIGNTLPEGKCIALIGHSRTLHAFTSDTCNQTGQTNSRWLNNCEVFEYFIPLE